jgi:hypothetical protein
VANLWEDLGVPAPAEATKGVPVSLRIDHDLNIDLGTVETALRQRGYRVSRSDIMRAATRSLVDSIIDALELPKSETAKPPVSQPLPKLGGFRRVKV